MREHFHSSIVRSYTPIKGTYIEHEDIVNTILDGCKWYFGFYGIGPE